MAKRRVQRNLYSVDDSDPYQGLSALEGLNPIDAPEEPIDLRGTRIPVESTFDMPVEPTDTVGEESISSSDRVVDESALPPVEQPIGVQDQLPQGLELLGQVAGLESAEDSLDAVGETSPDEDAYLDEQRSEMVVDQPTMGQEAPISDEGELPPAVQQAVNAPRKETITAEDIPQEGLGFVTDSVKVAQNDPAVMETVGNLLGGIQSIPPEVMERVELANQALSKRQDELTEMESRYLQKLESGDVTQLDNVAVGIALAIPVIMGMMYGKEAFIGSLAGSVGGLGKYLTAQESDDTKILENLDKIQKEKYGVDKDKQALNKELVDSIENSALRGLLRNNDVISVVQGANGEPEVTLGKDGAVFGDKLGISGKDELGVLWYDANLLRDDDDVKEYKKNTSEARDTVQRTQTANEAVDDVLDIMGVIKDQNPTMYNLLAQYVSPTRNSWIGGLNELAGTPFSNLNIKIKDKDGKFRDYKALPLLQQVITTLQDTYNTQFLNQNKLTEGIQNHWKEVFPNPASIQEWLTSDYDTMLKKAENFKSVINRQITGDLVGKGFLREPLQKVFPSESPSIRRSTMIDTSQVEADPGRYKSYVDYGV